MAAQAAVVMIDGDPLDITLGDTGKMQARFPDATGGQFYSPGDDEANSGLQLGVDVQEGPNGGGAIFGSSSAYAPFIAGQQNPVTGSGTAADPYIQVTTFSATTPQTQQPITVVQQAFYVNGTGIFRLRWDITNGGGTPTTVRPAVAADLYAGGSDSGTGFLEPGPPRVVGGNSSSGAGTGGIVEVTPWAHFQEDGFGTIFSNLANLQPGGGLQDTINPNSVDNGAGAQGADVTICATNCPAATTTFEAAWRFVNFLSLTPGQASNATGTSHTVNVRLINPDGSPRAGTPIVFNRVGVNNAQGTVAIGGDGNAQITWRGNDAGSDTLIVFADYNGNGVQDADEPSRQATVEWLAPVAGSTAVVEPVRGTVLVKLPPGASPSRYGLREEARQAQAGGFIPLRSTAALPVRTLVNVNKGEIAMTSARDLRGRSQTANFYSGTFQFLQRRTARPITEIALKGGSFRNCPRARKSGAGPEADSAQRRGRRVRRVWGNGRGNFRTRGRYSSATVRGTTWLTQDQCGGTLTRVGRRPRSSRVVVRDFVRRRNVTLRAGRSYFAFARR